MILGYDHYLSELFCTVTAFGRSCASIGVGTGWGCRVGGGGGGGGG